MGVRKVRQLATDALWAAVFLLAVFVAVEVLTKVGGS